MKTSNIIVIFTSGCRYPFIPLINVLCNYSLVRVTIVILFCSLCCVELKAQQTQDSSENTKKNKIFNKRVIKGKGNNKKQKNSIPKNLILETISEVKSENYEIKVPNGEKFPEKINLTLTDFSSQLNLFSGQPCFVKVYTEDADLLSFKQGIGAGIYTGELNITKWPHGGYDFGYEREYNYTSDAEIRFSQTEQPNIFPSLTNLNSVQVWYQFDFLATIGPHPGHDLLMQTPFQNYTTPLATITSPPIQIGPIVDAEGHSTLADIRLDAYFSPVSYNNEYGNLVTDREHFYDPVFHNAKDLHTVLFYSGIKRPRVLYSMNISQADPLTISETLNDTDVTLQWQLPPFINQAMVTNYVAYYEIQIASDPGFNQLIPIDGKTTTLLAPFGIDQNGDMIQIKEEISLSFAGSEGNTFYWRMRQVTDCDCLNSPWSVSTFAIPVTPLEECVRLTNLNPLGEFELYETNNGFVSGNNEYGDKAKADFFRNPNSNNQNRITQALFYFGAANTTNPNAVVKATIWDIDGNNGVPGTILAEENILITDIMSDVAGDFLTFVQFSNPPTVNGDFYIGIQMSNIPGDTVALYTNKNGATIPSSAWELQSSDVWLRYDNSFSWQVDISHAIFPLMCPPNTPPIANNDTITTYEDISVEIDVLVNDSDHEFDLLSVSHFDQGINGGNVTLNENGTFTYLPPTGFIGTDSFNYSISDGNGGSASAIVTIIVNPITNAPVITISPTQITATLEEGTTDNSSLCITNNGGSELVVSLGTENNNTSVSARKTSFFSSTKKTISDTEINWKKVKYVEKQLIVKFKDEKARLNRQLSLKSALSVSNTNQLKFIDAELWTINDISVKEACERFKNDPNIDFIEPNYICSLQNTNPNDTSFDSLWALNNTGQTQGTFDADIDAPEAWNIIYGSEEVIGIVDSGIDYTHDDLIDNMWHNEGEIPGNGIDDDQNGYIDDVYGWDFVNQDNEPLDDLGHGTHVAGIVGAKGNNENGITGVCQNAKLMALKFINSQGYGSTSDAIEALAYATSMGVRITNHSWGSANYSLALRNAIEEAGIKGHLIIAAAGNDDSDNDVFPKFPASYDLDNIISVAATDHNDELAGFSNIGINTVDLAAPGVSIYSTIPGHGYNPDNGTSMAAPYVTGVAALIYAQNSNLDPLEVKDILLSSVDPLTELSGKVLSGGRLNAFNALSRTPEPWLKIDNTLVAIAPGETQCINVALCATNLISGNYTNEILIRSNDPTNGLVNIPVQLTVTAIAEPEINIKQASKLLNSGDSIDFGIVAEDYTSDISFTINNDDIGDLILENDPIIAISGNDSISFSVLSQPSSLISGGDSSNFTIRFQPTSNGSKSAKITIESNDSDERLYMLNLTGSRNEAPSFTFIEPNGINDIANFNFIISWTDSDPDNNATISLYHDIDSLGQDGTLIVNGLSEDDLSDSYEWDTSTLPEGERYIYALIDDGVNDPVVIYSNYSVRVNNEIDLKVKSTSEINSNTINGPSLSDYYLFGSSIANLGDLDGDGVQDIAVGAAQGEKVYILFLKPDGSIKTTFEINSTTPNGPVLTASDYFGASVANLGDLDGDGIQDIVVGAYGDDANGDRKGTIHIIFLNSDGSPKNTIEVNSSTPNGPMLSNGDQLGRSVANLGDLDGDGIQDIVVGATRDNGDGLNKGAVHIIFLNSDGSPKNTYKINSNTSNGPILADSDSFGSSVANIGDLDNDGVQDIVVGANGDDGEGRDRGTVHIIYLNTDGSPKNTTEINANTVNGPIISNDNWFGISATNLGDLDGDGIQDIAVGAHGGSGVLRGAVHIIFLKKDGFPKNTIKISSSTANGPVLTDGDVFGMSVANLGDLDGNGIQDIAVGARRDDAGGRDRGTVHIIFLQLGDDPIPNTPPNLTFIEPNGENDIANTTFNITWIDSDPDNNASISLYEDSDSVGQDGTLIVSGLSEDDLSNSYEWDTSTLPEGVRYIYAVIDDGVNDPVVRYSSATVNIIHNFTPQMINGLKAWFDADDSVSFSESNGLISQWNDKSDENNHSSQITSSKQPILINGQLNGKPVVHFDGNTYLNFPNEISLEDFSVFAIVRSQNSSMLLGGHGANNYQIRIRESAERGISIYDNGGISYAPIATSQGNFLMATYIRNSTTAAFYENGFALINDGELQGNTFFIKYLASLSGIANMEGDIAEIIVYDNALLEQERQQVENYLMEKWLPDTQVNLPQQGVIPTIGLELWLDADNAATLTGQDGNISQWNDISGKNRHVTQVTEGKKPTLVNNQLNGKPTIRFEGSDYFKLPAYFNTEDFSVFAVTKSENSGMLLGGHGANNFQIRLRESNSKGISIYDNGGSAYAPINTDPNDFLLAEYVKTGTSAIFYENGLALSNNGQLAGNTFNLRYLASLSGIANLTGNIAEIIVYNHALSDQDRQQVEAYLIEKWFSNESPSINLIEPNGIDDIVNFSFTITWTDNDPDNNASISLYYDTDSFGQDGNLIVNGLSEDDVLDNYEWDTSTLPEGEYFIYAVIDDGVNEPVVNYSGGAVIVNNSTTEWREINKLLAEDGDNYDRFGTSASIAGDYAIVGAPNNSDKGISSGAAYIFKRVGGEWIEETKILPIDGVATDYFGESVSIFGDYLIIGAPGSEFYGDWSGAAYIFKKEGNSWTQQTKLLASDGAANDRFGNAVSISGNYAIVGSSNNSENVVNSGAAYIFKREGNSWTQQKKLTANDADAHDTFGSSVSISGDYTIIGAPSNDGNGTASGSAYIFKREGEDWNQQTKLLANDAAEYDFFGGAVSVFGDYAIVGASHNDDNSESSGSAYIFKRDGAIWNQQAKLLANDANGLEQFGNSVSISGNYVIIGALLDSDLGSNKGSAYIFKREGSSWKEQTKLYGSDIMESDQFGGAVSISDDYAIVGTKYHDAKGSNSGAAYIFGISNENTPPFISLIEPNGEDDIANTTFTITWTDSDPDNNATISLYEDTDSVGQDGTLIVGGLSEDDLSDSYEWDTSTLPEGERYIYAVIDDGLNDPMVRYSEGKIIVNHQLSLTVQSTVGINSNTLNGPILNNEDHFGYSIANLGDLDGDGIEDIAVGTYFDDEGGTNRGAVHIMLLNADGSPKSTVEINSSTPNGPVLSDKDYFGKSVANIGDLDGDGIQDLAVGAIWDDAGGSNKGAVHIIFLNADGTPKSTVEINDNTPEGPVLGNHDNFGGSIANLGDLDGDGIQDIVVGAHLDEEGGSNRGTVHIIFLNTNGSPKSTVEINSNTENGPVLFNNDYFGVAVANLEDLDGDGVQDIVVGAHFDDDIGLNQGAVHIIFLNTDGSVKSTVEIDASTLKGPVLSDDDRFGISVSNLGDLNGDGIQDIGVGAYLDDEGGPNRGTIHVIFLNSNGFPKATVELNSATQNGPAINDHDQFGTSVALIGDLNGDNLEEIAIGVMKDDEGGSNRGSVQIIFLENNYINSSSGTNNIVTGNAVTISGTTNKPDKNKFEADRKLLVYPNPSNNFITIQLYSGNDEIINMEIYNILGKKVSSIESRNSLNEKINLKEYGSGIYLISVVYNGIRKMKKVIIK